MDVNYMCSVVEDYIYKRKGVTVQIDRGQFNNSFLAFSLLNQAYQIAINYKEDDKRSSTK